MADRGNTKEYWDLYWSKPRSINERYSMRRVIEEVDKTNPKSILDVGCGRGKTLFTIKQKHPNIDCFGIDMSETAIRIMKAKYNIEGEVLDADKLNELNKTFDFITATHLLEHIYEDREFVKTVKNKLNKSGIFFVAVPNNMTGPEENDKHTRKYSAGTLRNLIEGVFGNCEIEIIFKNLVAISKKV